MPPGSQNSICHREVGTAYATGKSEQNMPPGRRNSICHREVGTAYATGKSEQHIFHREVGTAYMPPGSRNSIYATGTSEQHMPPGQQQITKQALAWNLQGRRGRVKTHGNERWRQRWQKVDVQAVEGGNIKQTQNSVRERQNVA